MSQTRRTPMLMFLVSLSMLWGLSIGVVAQDAPVTANTDAVVSVAMDDGGIPFVYVPSGCFMMGSDDQNASSNEMPAHEVCFDTPFFIDQYEVTNEQVGDSPAITTPSQFTDPQQPRDSVKWQDALAYCQSRMIDGQPMRLPTEAEWEYAARGPSNLIYPFGDAPAEAIGVTRSNSGGTTQQVGLYKAGASWVGAEDMAGNVWEWTSSIGDPSFPYPYNATDGRENLDNLDVPRVLRGGGANTFIGDMRASNRLLRLPDSAFAMIGFRCASDFVPGVVTIETLPEPDIQVVDNSQMAYITAGCFQMGSEDEQAEDNEQPIHEVCIDADYFIDVYEVTNAQVAQVGFTFAEEGRFTEDEQPRDSVTWIEAQDYCEARGGRLPTEAEWEFAARGSISQLYPWGSSFSFDQADFYISQFNSTAQSLPVGSRAETDVSLFGVIDVAGNISEWTSTIFEPYSGDLQVGIENVNDTESPRVVRGVNYRSSQFPRLSIRDSLLPNEFRETVGFRCVVPTDSPPSTPDVCDPITNSIVATLTINEVRVIDTRSADPEPDNILLRYFFNPQGAISDDSATFEGQVRSGDTLFTFESIVLGDTTTVTCDQSLDIVIRLSEGTETLTVLGGLVKRTIDPAVDYVPPNDITETVTLEGVTDNGDPFHYQIRYTVAIQAGN